MATTLSDRAFRLDLPAYGHALLLSVAMTLVIAVADYITGYELTLSVLYFAPIFVATWRCGLPAAFAVAAFAVVAWMTSDILAGHHYSHPFYRYWEGLIKLVTWAMFAVLLARLKAALDRSDERFVKVLEGLDAIVYVVDVADGALLYANPRCRELAGNVDRADALEGRWQRPADVCAANRLLDERGRPHGGITAELHDAERGRWYILHARAIRWVDGRLVRLQVATDITERREAELQARRRQGEMESATRLIMLGEMASTLAHELNQPLAAIANYNRGALRRLASEPGVTPDVVEALEKSASQAERAGRIIHRVRELVRRREPQSTACRLPSIARDVVAMLEPDLSRASVKVRIDVGDALPAVKADALLIEQALLNLCRNAIESMQHMAPSQCVIEIAAALQDDGRIEVRVSDTGCGVPATVVDNRHELFFTTREQGTGVGLHVCRSVLEAHGSRLVARRRAEGGSVLSFSLPRWPG